MTSDVTRQEASKPEAASTEVAASGDERPVHIFTVDVEEYFQVAAFESTISRADWGVLPARLHRCIGQLLELLAVHGVTATFFCLGWIGRNRPDVVRRIAAAGHEIASHGWSHRRVNQLSPDELRSEARRTKILLEDLTGQAVLGFRAPNFSIVPGAEWAFDVLLEVGYQYDSSIFPVRRGGYGYPGAPTTPYWIRRPGGELLELPLATLEWSRLRLPAAGGGYLRQLPYGLVRTAFARADAAGESAVFYVHPWELDPDQPRLPGSLLSRLRHYGGLKRTLPRLDRLLSEFHFTSVLERYRFDLGAARAREEADAEPGDRKTASAARLDVTADPAR